MKCSLHKVLFFFYLLQFSVGICFAQPYQSLFGSQYTSWNTYNEIPDAGFTDSLVTGNDTTINGKIYKIITEYYWGNGGFLREDTLQGKAWFMNQYDSTEYLIMDLGLSVNDSFGFLFGWSGGIKSVDSVYYDSGKKHIRFKVDSSPPLVFDSIYSYDTPIEFIEGIGTNIGIMYQRHSANPFAFSLLCASKDGQTIFQQFSFCRYDWLGINERGGYQNIIIFPNPFNNTTTIEIKTETFHSGYFIIYDLLGKEVKKIRIYEPSFTFYRDNLNEGIYFYQAVTDKNKIIAKGKMIVQ